MGRRHGFSRGGAADGSPLVDHGLARSVPRDRVVVLVQRFLLLDTNRLRSNGLRWLGEVFLQAFLTLTIYFVTDRLPYLHQRPSKVERIYDIAEGKPSQRRWKRTPWKIDTYADTNPTMSVTKYSGLNKIAMASFQPKTTKTIYIQYGICAMLDTVLLFAST